MKKIKKGLVVFAMLFSGAIVGATIASMVKSSLGDIDLAVPPWYVLLPALVLVAFFTILGHELGHVMGGALGRLRFVMLIVGPLRIAKEEGRLTFGLNRWAQMSGGLALCVPQTRQPSVGALLKYIAGGPLASLVLCLLCIATSFVLFDVDGSAAARYGAFFTFTGALFNGGIAIITALPLPTVGYDNDGKQLLDLLRGGQKAEAKLLLSMLSAEALGGKRPGEWSGEYVDRLIQLTGENDKQAGSVYLTGYFYFLDRGDVLEARKCINHMLASMDQTPSFIQPSLWLEIIYFQARYGGDIPALDEARERVKGPFIEKHSVVRMEAAILFAEGDYEKALERSMEGLALAGNVKMQAGMISAEVTWLENIAAQCSGKLSALSGQNASLE